MSSRPSLMLLITGFADQIGGIQRVNELVINVCDEYSHERDIDLIVVSRNDPVADELDLSSLSGMRFVGCGGSKARFLSSAVIWAARRRPAAVYVGSANFAGIGLMLKLARLIGPYAVQLFGIEVWERLPVMRRAGLLRARRVVSISKYTAAAAVAHSGVDASKVRVVPPALLPRWTAMATGLDAPEVSQIPTLLTIARLPQDERRKKVGDVIAILGGLAEKGLDFHYVVVGEGSGKAELEAQATSLGLDDRVTFTGSLTDPEVHRLLGSCDIFVMPSTQEGFGLVFLEAMWHGKPVVAAAAGGAPEVVIAGHTGVLVPSDDSDELSAVLEELLGDADMRDRLGRAGAERVRSEFSIERFRSAMFEELDRLMPAEG